MCYHSNAVGTSHFLSPSVMLSLSVISLKWLQNLLHQKVHFFLLKHADQNLIFLMSFSPSLARRYI